MREWSLLSACQHPNVAQSYGLVVNDVLDEHIELGLVLECADSTLHSWIRDARPSRAAVRDAFLQLCRGLHALHAGYGLAHACLRPSNVLVWWSKTAPARVRVSDVGGESDTSRAEVAAYCAPEQFDAHRRARSGDGGEPDGVGVDVWALGVMLLEAFGGDTRAGRVHRVWPAAHSAADIARAVRDACSDGELPVVGPAAMLGFAMPARAPSDIARIVVDGCLRFDARERWSVARVLEALERADVLG